MIDGLPLEARADPRSAAEKAGPSDGLATLIGGEVLDPNALPPRRRAEIEDGLATLVGGEVLDPSARPRGHETVKLEPDQPSPKAASEKVPSGSWRSRAKVAGALVTRSIAIAREIPAEEAPKKKGAEPKRKKPPRRPRSSELGSPWVGYELKEQIGRGGMGVVYRAYAPQLDRTCAIKIRARETLDLREICRFQNEAVLAARLRHPHIVGVFDAGEDEGRFYLVMEYVEGVTLTRWIAEHSSPDDLSRASRS